MDVSTSCGAEDLKDPVALVAGAHKHDSVFGASESSNAADSEHATRSVRKSEAEMSLTPVPPTPPSPSTRLPASSRPKPGTKVIYVTEKYSADDTLLEKQYVSKLEELTISQKQSGGPAFEVVRTIESTQSSNTLEEKMRNDRAEPFGNVPESNVFNFPPAPPPIYSPSRRESSRHLRIHSRSIINALQSVVNYYPYRAVVGDPVEIYEPFAILVHHWDELKSFREKFDPAIITEDTTNCLLNDTYEDLGHLLDFLEADMGEKVRAEQARWALPTPKASFEMLWYLLKPGTDVYYSDGDGTRSAAVVSYVSALGDTEQDRKYCVKFWQMHGVGLSVQPYEFQRMYLRFHGEKPISDLHIFPAQYLPEDRAYKQALTDQGSLYCSLLTKKCMHFEGKGHAIPGLKQWPPGVQARRPIPSRTYRGNVMLDPERQDPSLTNSVLPPNSPAHVEAVDLKPSGTRFCTCNRCSKIDTEMTRPAKFAGYQRVALANGEVLNQHQRSLCPRTMWGFVLDIRDWRHLSLEGFTEARWSPDLIDSLVLKPSYKSMLQNLCRMFVQNKAATKIENTPQDHSNRSAITPWAADFVENKGKGLIFLLHGRPGVGKTYTAECIADHVQRPLLSISCADIGVDPSQVEQNLRHWLDLGRRWDAIVLLDEADIYMEYRQIHDLQRNSLVASFLQAIEYYDGVLFLTTNRIGTFDEAFLSRINALYYGDFSDNDRQRVWNNYFDKLEREREDIYVPESTKDYVTNKDVKALKWNGREIRNAFQVAVNLAQAEGVRDAKKRIVVKRHHIEVTVNLSADFKDYMKSVRKKDESERARLAGNRDDSYKALLTTPEPGEYE